MSKKRKCIRPGPLTNNGYLNFLREFRKCNCSLTGMQSIVQGGKAWASLSRDEKCKLMKEVSNELFIISNRIMKLS